MKDTQQLPHVIVISDVMYKALPQAATLIRSKGYIFSEDAPPTFFPSAGTCVLTMVKGDPLPDTLTQVDALTVEAIELAQAEYDREVKAVAERLIEDARRAAKQKEIDAVKAEQRKQIAQLEKELAK